MVLEICANNTKQRTMKFNIRQFLHSLAAFIERHSPMKGELVDVEITKVNGRISYTYRKVA